VHTERQKERERGKERPNEGYEREREIKRIHHEYPCGIREI
jgi:hypothetical protein